MTRHKTGTQEECARKQLLEREREHSERGKELARQRQELPWVPVEKEYRFETDEGTRTLAELFDGRSQLLAYHLMFGPDYTAACPGCSSLADHFDGGVVHLNHRDLTFLAISRAPLDKLQAYKERIEDPPDWLEEWAEAVGTDLATGLAEGPGWQAFALSDGVAHHTYSSYAPDGLAPYYYQLLDQVPKGRGDELRVRRHDEYEDATTA